MSYFAEYVNIENKLLIGNLTIIVQKLGHFSFQNILMAIISKNGHLDVSRNIRRTHLKNPRFIDKFTYS